MERDFLREILGTGEVGTDRTEAGKIHGDLWLVLHVLKILKENV